MVVVDGAIILVFLVAYTLAFIGGLGRAALALLTTVVILVAAAAFTVPVAQALQGVLHSLPLWASELLALLLLSVIFGLLTPFVITRAVTLVPHVRRSVMTTQGSIGLIVLALVAFAFAAVLTVMLGTVTGNVIASLPPGSVQRTLVRAIDQSVLFPGIVRLSATLVHLTIDWVPGIHPQLLHPLTALRIAHAFWAALSTSGMTQPW
ncbi:MAG: hypothetical protein IRY86_04910 [Thermorudis peleae]|nr:hypothetical protein [Thermorudis peleae]